MLSFFTASYSENGDDPAQGGLNGCMRLAPGWQCLDQHHGLLLPICPSKSKGSWLVGQRHFHTRSKTRPSSVITT